ncbi:ABC-2 type transport system permease protein [Gilliamella bombicola]|uniref:ABC-2 type transport system permease protein n=1 Tax=Gilliamella bombicola TaxID=1798182 RepID=A0A1C4ABT6_9GAMM|nr:MULTISPECIES: ABC transporter permease [Gilliamella]NUF27201.1 ABC transporter permease [Gilliamella sp. ESL0254]SCB92056.1 ABC-2 type transport system permease protein [Gilliamella bombicola]
MIKSLLLISYDELKRIFQTKAIVSVMFVGIFIYFFFYPQPYLNEAIRDVPIAVIDQDNSNYSRELIRQMDANKSIKIDLHIADLQTAKKQIEERKIYGAILVPYRFQQHILEGKTSPVLYYGDASYILIYSNVATAINTVASNFGANISISRKIAQGVDPAVATNNVSPFNSQLISLFNPQSGYATYIIPAAFILILYQTLLIGSILCRLFSKNSNFEQDFIKKQNNASSSALLLLSGKLLTYLILYLIYFIIYTVFANYWYELPRLSHLSVSLSFIIPFIFSTALLGKVISHVVHTVSDVFCLIIPTSMVIFFVTGLSWPKELMPPLFHLIGDIFPAVPAIVGSVKINQMGASFAEFSAQYWHLWILTIVYFCIAFMLEKRCIQKAMSAYIREEKN